MYSLSEVAKFAYQAGLARAKAEGKVLGRPAKTTLEQRAAMVEGYAAKESVSALARRYGVSRATVLTVVKPEASPPQSAA